MKRSLLVFALLFVGSVASAQPYTPSGYQARSFMSRPTFIFAYDKPCVTVRGYAYSDNPKLFMEYLSKYPSAKNKPFVGKSFADDYPDGLMYFKGGTQAWLSGYDSDLGIYVLWFGGEDYSYTVAKAVHLF